MSNSIVARNAEEGVSPTLRSFKEKNLKYGSRESMLNTAVRLWPGTGQLGGLHRGGWGGGGGPGSNRLFIAARSDSRRTARLVCACRRVNISALRNFSIVRAEQDVPTLGWTNAVVSWSAGNTAVAVSQESALEIPY